MSELNLPHGEDVKKLVKRVNDSQELELTRKDLDFVALIAGLQILRQYLSRKKILNMRRLNDQESANLVKHNSVVENVIKNKNYGEWILGPTSYDAIARSSTKITKTGLSGMNHRYKTLAHDPLVGLLVGPINLMSETITFSDEDALISLKTSNVVPTDYGRADSGYQIGEPTTFTTATATSIEYVKNDAMILPAAVVKHLLHLASDVGTQQGLPIPGLSLLPNIGEVTSASVNSWLLENHFDAMWIANIGVQYGLAEFINTISSIIYRFLRYRNSPVSAEIVKRKTDKVIAVANGISTSQDLIRSLMKAQFDLPNAIRELDFGGLIATIKRLIQSDEFKDDIKNIDKIWNQVVFGMTHSVEDLEIQLQTQLRYIDSKYSQIMEEMLKEYEVYANLQENATNWNQSAKSQFESSVEFAKLNNVTNYLSSKEDIYNFFNN